jgi:hypothetical protein
MRAKVTTAFNGWNELDPAPRDFAEGEEIEGNIAYQAFRAGFAEWVKPPSDAEREALEGQQSPGYTVQPVGTERPADGDKPEVMAKVTAALAAAQEPKVQSGPLSTPATTVVQPVKPLSDAMKPAPLAEQRPASESSTTDLDLKSKAKSGKVGG